ncbi:protein indeterminate-domain 2 [Senna tora]|uniref:Protein indeterminate-domain 2 n=1 Tax=Senna tora TaxID=362788 RepID=A0A834SKI7_9FABA|nr:protein indeterminate-domain 2 [Senna tora]
MSNITSCDSGSFSTSRELDAVVVKQQTGAHHEFHSPNSLTSTTTTSNVSDTNSHLPPLKKKRSLPGNPDPNAEVIALSPNTLMARNRFVCEICNKGFQRDQNLQLHRRGHNLPWKLKQRSSTEVRKRVYVCPEASCVHHNPARALGDLTGIKKHFSRKHGEKKWKCDKCSKRYAVQSDWKAHSKICGTREYKCDCGTIFSRRDSFITHRAFCDALAEENNKGKINDGSNSNIILQGQQISNNNNSLACSLPMKSNNNVMNPHISSGVVPEDEVGGGAKVGFNYMRMRGAPAGSVFTNEQAATAQMSATALLQKAAQMGATMSNAESSAMAPPSFGHPYINTSDISSSHSHHQYLSSGMMGLGSNIINNSSVGIGINSVDMFNVILDQSKALSKMIEHNNTHTNTGGGVLLPMPTSKGSAGDVMTLDFLGIGGGGGAAAAHHDAFLWRQTG